MSSTAKLRHGICIFALMGLLTSPLAQGADSVGGITSLGGTWNQPAFDAAVSGTTLSLQLNSVLTFRVRAKLNVALSPDLSQRTDLQPGDVIDAAVQMPIDEGRSQWRANVGEDFYVKSELAILFKDQRIIMKIKDAADPSLIGHLIYIQTTDLTSTNLIYASGVGYAFQQAKLVAKGHPFTEDDNLKDDHDNTVTFELPDFPIKAHAPSIAPHFADRTRVLPTLKPDTPNLKQTIDQAFAPYSTSKGVNRLISSANSHVWTVNQRGRRSLTYVVWERKKIRRHTRTVKMTMCWRSVKDALKSSGMVDSDFASNSPDAYMARRALLNDGWRDLLADPRTRSVMRDPNMAPRGAILVYEDVVGGRVRHDDHANTGHVEIKTASAGFGGYISIKPEPEAAFGLYAQGRRRLTGVMVRDR